MGSSWSKRGYDKMSSKYQKVKCEFRVSKTVSTMYVYFWQHKEGTVGHIKSEENRKDKVIDFVNNVKIYSSSQSFL